MKTIKSLGLALLIAGTALIVTGCATSSGGGNSGGEVASTSHADSSYSKTSYSSKGGKASSAAHELFAAIDAANGDKEAIAAASRAYASKVNASSRPSDLPK